MRRIALAATAVAWSCTPHFVPGAFEPVPAPAPSEVASIIFLVGDAGATPLERSPVVHRLRADVEEWSETLARDSAVSVFFLGDNVYPDGIRDSDGPHFAADSARLHAQVWAVSGAQAARHGSFGVFLPGNHDWGNMSGPRGEQRLRNQERALERHRAAGAAVELLPAGGDPGPGVVDLDGVRVLTFDTHWWLQSESEAERAEALTAVEHAINGSDGRPVMFMGHHPFVTGGPHSGLSTGFDPLWLLRKVGANVQDMNSGPYKSLRAHLSEVFEQAGPPLIYAAGHDHSLQVLRGDSAGDPIWSLVSGGASKLTDVADRDEMEWASAQPGYMRLLVLKDGGVLLYVESAPERFLACEAVDAMRCISNGLAAFSTTFSKRLR